jgi:hypothetical protein
MVPPKKRLLLARKGRSSSEPVRCSGAEAGADRGKQRTPGEPPQAPPRIPVKPEVVARIDELREHNDGPRWNVDVQQVGRISR